MRFYRNLGPVDIAPLLEALPFVPFQNLQVSTRHKDRCLGSVGELPRRFHDFADSLKLGGETRKLFIRKLLPYIGIPAHIDEASAKVEDLRRFHVPLISEHRILMSWPDDGVQVHLQPGFLWEVDFTRKHEVINPVDVYRTHLTIDQIGSTVEPL